MKKRPKLSKEDINHLLGKHKEDPVAMQKLMDWLTPLIVKVAKIYYKEEYPTPFADLVEAGTKGVINSIDAYKRYTDKFGTKRISFQGYAIQWARAYIIDLQRPWLYPAKKEGLGRSPKQK